MPFSSMSSPPVSCFLLPFLAILSPCFALQLDELNLIDGTLEHLLKPLPIQL